MWLHLSISLSHSLMLLNFSTSSFCSATRLSRDHLPGHTKHSCSLCCPLVQTPGSGTPCSQTPGQLCVRVEPPSGWPLSLATAFALVETTARRSPWRVMSTSQIARRGTEPCPRELPHKLLLHTLPDTPHPVCQPWLPMILVARSPWGLLLGVRGVWPLSHSSSPH